MEMTQGKFQKLMDDTFTMAWGATEPWLRADRVTWTKGELAKSLKLWFELGGMAAVDAVAFREAIAQLEEEHGPEGPG